MQNAIHEALNKLRLIGKIHEGQSLDTTTGNIYIYDFNIWNWIWRKLYRDGKCEVTRWLQDFYVSLDQVTEQLISDINNIKDEVRKNRLIEIAITLAERLKGSFVGIENISKTYSSYPKTVAELDGIVQDYMIITYKHLMSVLPQEKLSKTLKENITYHGIIQYMGVNHINDMCDTE